MDLNWKSKKYNYVTNDTHCFMLQVNTLEQRFLSIQGARTLRCTTCRPLITRLQELEQRLTELTTERKQHLRELMLMK